MKGSTSPGVEPQALLSIRDTYLQYLHVLHVFTVYRRLLHAFSEVRLTSWMPSPSGAA